MLPGTGGSSTGGLGTTSGFEPPDSEGTSEGAPSCVDEDVGSAVGRNLVLGTTVGAGDDYFPLCASIRGLPPSTAEDYVVSWTAPDSGQYRVSLEGSNFDTVLAVTEPQCDGLDLDCNDDCVGFQSTLILVARAGEQFFIVIDGFAEESGDFQLSIEAGDVLACEAPGDPDPDRDPEGGTDDGGGKN